MASTRLSQGEKRQRTRSALLDSASRVFARHGFHAASLDDVAEDAGYSKGALTYNWTSKEELFLDLLELRLRDRSAQIHDAAEGLEDRRPTGREIEGVVRALPFDREWSLLFLEFTCFAARRPAVRRRFSSRLDELRLETARVVDSIAPDPSLPPGQLSRGLSAMANGLSIDALLDPDDKVPDELFATMLVRLLVPSRAEPSPRS